jgi:hypothetical protein
MAGYQFVHVEVYARAKTSRKKSAWTAADIVNEAERRPGNCGHVANPTDPEVLYGTLPSEALEDVEKLIAEQRDPRGRRIRRDTPCLLAGVASFPIPVGLGREEEVRSWVRDCVVHLKAEFGSALKSVLLHTDEKFPHLHFYATAPDGKAKAIHPGHRVAKKAGKGTFKKAMSAWLDQWYEAVSRRHGMARTGPKRERLSREEWRARQRSAEDLAKADKVIETAESIRLDLESKKVGIAGQLRSLNAEMRKLDRRGDDLTSQDIERQKQIKAEQDALKEERSKLKAREAQMEIDAERIRKEGLQLIDFQKHPASEQSRLAKDAQDQEAKAKEQLRMAQERADSLEATLDKEIQLVKAMEALLTPEQKNSLRKSRPDFA